MVCVGEGAGILTCAEPAKQKMVKERTVTNTFFIINFLVKNKVNQNKSLLSGKVNDFACIVFAY